MCERNWGTALASTGVKPMRDPSLRIIYLDTNLWNRLLEQNIDPTRLLEELKLNNANLAISGHTVYELAKTFRRSPDKAKKLFHYVRKYVDAGIIFARDNMEQLHGEVEALMKGASTVVAFYAPDGVEYNKLQEEVAKLSEGIVDEQALQFMTNRQQFAQGTRAAQKTHLDGKPETTDQLKSVPDAQFPAWLGNEVVSESGIGLLVGHLLRMYSDIPLGTAKQVAQPLLQIPPSRISKGLVRADLYYNWRCASRGSNPSDLLDDIYHVLNASYCDIYATAEVGQDNYASLLLDPWTKVAIYDSKTAVDEWLLALAGAKATIAS